MENGLRENATCGTGVSVHLISIRSKGGKEVDSLRICVTV